MLNQTAARDEFFGNPEAAAYLGVSPITLAKWRVYGAGPAFYKLNRKVVYRRSDLDAWLLSKRRTSTCEGARV